MKKKPLGIQGKMVFSYSALLVAAVVLLVGTAYYYIAAVSRKNAELSLSQLAEKTLAQVEAYLLEMDKTAQYVCADNHVVNVFAQLETDKDPGNYFEKNIMERIDVATALASAGGPGSPVFRVSLFNGNGDFVSAGAAVSREEIPAVPKSMLDPVAGFARIITPPELDHWSEMYGGMRFISLYRPISDYYGRNFFGAVEVQRDLDKLASSVSLNSGILVFVRDFAGEQILPSGTRLESLDENDYLVISRDSAEFGWSVVLAQSSGDIIAPYGSLIFILFVGGAALIAWVLTLVYVASKRFSKPIIEMSKMVSGISIGSIPCELPSEAGTDELRQLGGAVSFMLTRVKDSLALEKQAYLLALQSQMNPHFLFNTLSVISGMAIEKGDDRIADVCEKLGAMLRYSSAHDTNETTLRDEIENIQNYLDMMKYRFEDNFTFHIDADERLMDMSMPSLTLQPLIENCFEHGFRGVPMPWRINVRAKAEAGGWSISVSDNGKGFSADDIEDIERKAEAYSKDLSAKYKELKLGGMGLINTVMRLKLSMNTRIDYSINNLAPSGAEIILKGSASDDTGSDS